MAADTWKVVITPLSTEGRAHEAIVEADNWLAALRGARDTLGEQGGMPAGASCVVSETHEVTVLDPGGRRRFVLKQLSGAQVTSSPQPNAPAGESRPSPRFPVSRPSSRPAPAAVNPGSVPSGNTSAASGIGRTAVRLGSLAARRAGTLPALRADPAPAAHSLLEDGRTTHPSGSPAAQPQPATQPAARTNGDAGIDSPAATSPSRVIDTTASPAAPEARPAAATPAAAPRGPAAVLLFSREENHTRAAPLTYRERGYYVAAPYDRQSLEACLRQELAQIQQELMQAPAGKFVSLAAFDHSFQGTPQRPPLATLQWRDWVGPARVTFGPQVPGAAEPTPSAGAQRLTAAHAAPPPVRDAWPAPSSLVPDRHDAAPPPVRDAWPAPSSLVPDRHDAWPAPSSLVPDRHDAAAPLPAAPAAPGMREKAVPDVFAPIVPTAPAAARQGSAQIEASAVFPASPSPSSDAASSVPVRPAQPEAAARAASAGPPPGFPPSPLSPLPSGPATAQLPPAATETPVAVEPAAAPGFAPTAQAPARPHLEVRAEPPETEDRQERASAQQAPAPAELPSRLPRRETTGDQDSRLATAFEAIQDLFFLSTPLEGLNFAVGLLADLIPSEAISGCIYDINTDEFRFIALTGPGADERQASAIPRRAGLFGVAAQAPERSLVVDALASDPRYEADVDGRLGLTARNAAFLRLQHGDHLLGMLQLVNREGAAGFSAADLAVADYIADKTMEFLQARRSIHPSRG